MAVSSMSTCWVVCVHAGTRGAARVDGVRYLMVDGCDFYANGFLHIHVIIIQMSVTKALLELEGDRSRESISLVQDVLNLTYGVRGGIIKDNGLALCIVADISADLDAETLLSVLGVVFGHMNRMVISSHALNKMIQDIVFFGIRVYCSKTKDGRGILRTQKSTFLVSDTRGSPHDVR